MTVTHKQVYRNGAFGTVNTTLCGRVSHAENDYNTGEEVTCKLCQRIEKEPGHWRNKNLVQTG